MALVACLIGIVFFILAIIKGYTVFDSFIFVIGIALANIPEGFIILSIT